MFLLLDLWFQGSFCSDLPARVKEKKERKDFDCVLVAGLGDLFWFKVLRFSTGENLGFTEAFRRFDRRISSLHGIVIVLLVFDDVLERYVLYFHLDWSYFTFDFYLLFTYC